MILLPRTPSEFHCHVHAEERTGPGVVAVSGALKTCQETVISMAK